MNVTYLLEGLNIFNRNGIGPIEIQYKRAYTKHSHICHLPHPGNIIVIIAVVAVDVAVIVIDAVVILCICWRQKFFLHTHYFQ